MSINTSVSLDNAIQEVVEGVGREMMARIVRRTPRNTGAAQEGWELAITPGGFEISNPVEYVKYLEEGTYKMRAYSMVRTTLEETDQIVAQVVRSI